MSHYTGYKYDYDPGFHDIGVEKGNRSRFLCHLWRWTREQRRPQRTPKYGKMPGGGGAGAIMGPMEWTVRPTIEGIMVHVDRDQKFVSHGPRVCAQGEERNLTKAQGPYEGLNGKWTFASVFPLTPTLLKIFPKEMLKYMRGEIYARYGDTFTDPEVQAYFDAQPWYQKRPGEKITLTDIERFNYNVIVLRRTSMARLAIAVGDKVSRQKATGLLFTVYSSFRGIISNARTRDSRISSKSRTARIIIRHRRLYKKRLPAIGAVS